MRFRANKAVKMYRASAIFIAFALMLSSYFMDSGSSWYLIKGYPLIMSLMVAVMALNKLFDSIDRNYCAQTVAASSFILICCVVDLLFLFMPSLQIYNAITVPLAFSGASIITYITYLQMKVK